MSLRKAYGFRPLVTILAAVMVVVALACGGEAATPTSAPTATKPAPTATVSSGPTATAPADATATPVPEATVPPDMTKDFVNYLLQHPGYQEKWGTPKYGGIIKTADPRPATNFQLNQFGYLAFSRWQFASFNSLLMFDPWLPMGSPVMCDLCESWSVSADGKTYTFKLRENVQFQSEGWAKDKGAPGFGDELVCEDIQASHEWFARPHKATNPGVIQGGKKYMGHLDKVTCPDGPQGKTAVLNFSYFRNPTTGWLASGIAIWDKGYRQWMDEKYPGIQSTAQTEGYLINMGTGPQIPTFADSQSVMKVKRNPNYFIKGAPFADGYEFYAIQDYNTKFASLVTGKIQQAGHGSSGITKAQVVQVQRDYPELELHIVAYNHISVLMLNPMRPPFDKWKVRQAVNLALDRKSWDEFMTAGAVKMSSPAFWSHPDAGWGIPVEEFQKFPGFRQDKKDADIAEANRILDEEFGKGVRPRSDQYVIQLLSRREISIWGLDQFKKHLNWEFDVKFVDEYGKIGTDCLYTIRAEAAPVHGNTYITDPSDTFAQMHSKLTTATPCYIRGWKGTDEGKDLETELARVDALIDQQDVMLDQVKRLELARELELYMGAERLAQATMGTMNVGWPNRPELKGVYYFNLGTYSQQRLLDRMWLAE
jgi:ABC-type transport system substrate-binding protein